MLRFIGCILLFILLVNPLQAQETCVTKGQFTVSAAYGFPSIARMYLKIKTTRAEYGIKGFGPFLFKTDYQFHKRWSIGANLAFNYSTIFWMEDAYDTVIHGFQPYEFGMQMWEFSGSLRANYHYVRSAKVDAYAGMGIGYGLIKLSSYTYAPLNQFNLRYDVPRPLAMEATTGCRYFLNRHLALFAEAGIGKSWILFRKYFIPEAVIQGGLTLRFPTKQK